MNKTVLSGRLSAVAEMADRCFCGADIGTDHGHLPVWLVRNGIWERAIGADVREGPLGRAREYVNACGLGSRIDLRLSDGFSAIAAGEAETAVISGMGGLLIQKILSDGGDTVKKLRSIVTAPQSEAAALRYYLTDSGFYIDRERLILEKGIYYPVIHCVNAGCALERARDPGSVQRFSDSVNDGCNVLKEEEAAFGPFLLKNHDSSLFTMLCKRREVCLGIIENIDKNGSSAASARRNEVKKELRIIENALKRYEM